MKKILSIVTIFTLVSCSSTTTEISIEKNLKKTETTKNTIVSQLKESKIELSKQNVEDVILADLGTQNGAEFKVKIDIKEGFTTKANVNGTAEKKLSDIAKADVYLLSLASAPAAGSNPLGVANANVIKSFTGVAKTDGGTGFTLLFKGVPGLATNQYFVGVVLKDSANNVINKAPTTPWTLDTLATSSSLAVSSSGVGVNNTTFAVSTTTALTVTTNLLDAVGAQIDTTATSTAGTNGLTGAGVTIQ
ncbi:MAG: hypothetical protein AABZ74_16680 [Cyanobacteriota bacterium]